MLEDFTPNKRCLVISAGGSKGSFAGGIVEYYQDQGRHYDMFLGSSTGALIVPMAVNDDIGSAKKAYTTITNKDIFTRDPFIVTNHKNGVFKYKIDNWSIAKNMLIYKKKTLGDTSKLRYETLPKIFTKEKYDMMVKSCETHGKEIAVCVTNYTLKQREYKDLHKCSYEDALDWIWASTSAPPFTSIIEKDGYEYVDGGIMTMVPLREALKRGADEVDVIVLQEENPAVSIEKTRNILHFIIGILSLQLDDRMGKDSNPLNLLRYIKDDKVVKLNMHYTKRKLTNNSLIFEPEATSKWWQEGYDYAKNEECKTYLVTRNGYQTFDDDNSVITTVTKNEKASDLDIHDEE